MQQLRRRCIFSDSSEHEWSGHERLLPRELGARLSQLELSSFYGTAAALFGHFLAFCALEPEALHHRSVPLVGLATGRTCRSSYAERGAAAESYPRRYRGRLPRKGKHGGRGGEQAGFPELDRMPRLH